MDQNNNNAAGAAGMNEFFTRGTANEGIQVPLWRPDGTKSEHWVRIRGIDSDAFRQADAEARRDAIRIAQLDSQAERAAEIAKAKRRLTAHLVVAWSFDQPCTVDNVEAFFVEAPQIMDSIDVAASKRTLFFAAGSNSSQPSPSTSSSST